MSWKQYGGIRKNDKLNNLALGTLVADDILLRQVKVTTHIFEDTIVAKKDILRGEKFSFLNLTEKRTGKGTGTFNIIKLIGRKTNRTYKKNQIINI